MTGETALGFLAGYYACAEKLDRLPGVAGQVAKSRSIDPTPPDPTSKGPQQIAPWIGKLILYVVTGTEPVATAVFLLYK